MSTSIEVKEAVREFVAGRKQFTSVDVSNEIKKAGTWRRNRDVAKELRSLFASNDPVFDGYDRANIAVDAGAKTAALYLPCGTDPEDYTDRDQKALGPATAKPSIGAAPTVAPMTKAVQALPVTPTVTRSTSILKRVPRAKVTQQTDASDIADVLDMDIVMSKVIRTKERIKIPGPMIRKLGWTPGQPADLSHIKTHHAVKVGVIVAKDYRVSIPRSAVKWGVSPVKVMLTANDDIIFDQA